MSTVVVYSSQTGFTKRYAEWLAEELGCQVVSLGDEPRFDASGFDVVVLGGWSMREGSRARSGLRAPVRSICRRGSLARSGRDARGMDRHGGRGACQGAAVAGVR